MVRRLVVGSAGPFRRAAVASAGPFRRAAVASAGPFRRAAVASALLLGACSSNHPSDLPADLPSDWSGAHRVKGLVQEQCQGVDMEFSNESASFSGAVGSIGVVYQDAHFRCEQQVEGFFKSAGDAVDILVQPIDMDPAAVAGCDCGYKITFVVEPVSSGPHTTTLYRRWDSINKPNNPFAITSTSPQVIVE